LQVMDHGKLTDHNGKTVDFRNIILIMTTNAGASDLAKEAIGFGQGGLLTDAIDQHPHAVLLLDEIEKAHPDLFNILLQVIDHGKLTDHNGKVVDFRNVILIMTTNAGASDLAKEAIGFGRETRVGEDEEAIKRLFTPEFRNRLDAIIAFDGLTQETVGRVVEKFVMQLEAQLADRNVTIELSSAAKEWLAERGYDRLYGARPLARVIQEYIKKPLAEELLFGKLVKGGAVKVTLKDGKLEFDIVEAALPAMPKPEGDDDGGADRYRGLGILARRIACLAGQLACRVARLARKLARLVGDLSSPRPGRLGGFDFLALGLGNSVWHG